MTQPDRPAGRGRGVLPPPVKVYAESQGLRVLQPATLRDASAQADIRSLEPEVIVIAAYGLILPRGVVESPPLGCVNIHPSLLPRHRGPSPVAFTILEGDETAGVSLMLLDRGTDSGPVLAQEERPALPEDTTGTLTDELFRRGAELLARVLPAYGRGELTPVPQDDGRATYARKLTKEDGAIRWELSAVELWRQSRAFTPWPGSYARLARRTDQGGGGGPAFGAGRRVTRRRPAAAARRARPRGRDDRRRRAGPGESAAGGSPRYGCGRVHAGARRLRRIDS